MKDEIVSVAIKEFLGLKHETYIFLLDDISERE